MSETLRAWLSEELERRKWSQGELARQSGISRPYISQVLLGDVGPSINFVAKIAQALDEAPEKLLRLSGILPASPASEDDTLQELTDLARNLSPAQRRQVLDFAQFLYRKNKE